MIAWPEAALAWQLNVLPCITWCIIVELSCPSCPSGMKVGALDFTPLCSILTFAWGHGHSLSDLYIARCIDGKYIHIQCDLKLANVDLGC